MSLKIDRVQLEIIIGNDAARKEMAELEGDIKRFTSELAKMKKAGKEDTDEWKAKKAELIKAREGYDAIIDKIGILNLTSKELIKRQRELKAILEEVRPNNPEYEKYRAQLQAINTRIGELKAGHAGLNDKLQNFWQKFGKFADLANRYQTVLLGIAAAITGVVLSIKDFIQGNAELSDAQANVMKTTGLTRKEVEQLSSKFKELNTRTSTMDLLKLAEDAGRLGKEGVPAIFEFVDAANQIKTALGDDLGQDAIKNTGKLAEAFEIAKTNNVSYRDSLLKTGSVLNTVAAKSSADADYLVDFSKRVAGMALQSKISLQNVMGIASALDQNLQTSEQSSTVVTTLLTKMFVDTATYSKLAGMGVKEFTELLKKDANGALIALLKGLKNNNAGFSELAQSFDKMGFDGTRAINVIGVLSQKVGLIEEQQKIANDAFDKGSSIIDEYNTKNRTMAGNLEIIGKAIKGAFVNSTVNKVMGEMVDNVAELAKTNLSDTLKKEQTEMQVSVKYITSVNLSNEDRIKKIKELQAQFPDYFKNLNAENATNSDLEATLANVNAQYEKKIKLQIYQEDLEKNIRETVKLQTALEELNKTVIKIKEGKGLSSDEKMQADITLKSLGVAYDLASLYKGKEAIVIFEKQISDLLNKRAEINRKINESDKPNELIITAPSVNKPVGSSSTKGAVATSSVEVNDRKKILEELRQITLKYQAQAIDDEVVRNEAERVAAIAAMDEKLKDKDGNLKADLKKTKEYQDALTAINNDYSNKEQQIWLKHYEKRLKDNEEFIGREMSDNRLTYAERLNTLEKYFDDEMISREYYENEKLKLNNDMRQKLEQLENEYGLLKETDKRAVDLALYKQFLDAKLITDQQYAEAKSAIENKLTAEEKQKLEEKKQMYTQAASAIGNAMYAFTSGQTQNFREFGKTLIMIALDMLKKEAEIAVAKITIGSLASAESIATWGVAGIAKAAALTALVEAAFGAVKGLVQQAADGRYPVVGASDGKTYYPGYARSLKTGIVSGPLLVGEAGSEAIIDHSTLTGSQRDAYGMTVMDHYKSILAIRAGQGLPVPQRYGGNYVAANGNSQGADVSALVAEMQAMRTEISQWQRNFKVNFVMTEYDKRRKLLDDMNKDITYNY